MFIVNLSYIFIPDGTTPWPCGKWLMRRASGVCWRAGGSRSGILFAGAALLRYSARVGERWTEEAGRRQSAWHRGRGRCAGSGGDAKVVGRGHAPDVQRPGCIRGALVLERCRVGRHSARPWPLPKRTSPPLVRYSSVRVSVRVGTERRHVLEIQPAACCSGRDLPRDNPEQRAVIIGLVAEKAAQQFSETDLAMMRRALLAAEDAAEKGEVPVGAVVARGGEILAVAANEREASRRPHVTRRTAGNPARLRRPGWLAPDRLHPLRHPRTMPHVRRRRPRRPPLAPGLRRPRPQSRLRRHPPQHPRRCPPQPHPHRSGGAPRRKRRLAAPRLLPKPPPQDPNRAPIPPLS